MTPLAIALIVLVAMFLLGLPIFMSLIISSVVAILAGGDILPLSVIHNSLFDGLNLFPLLAIPCFVVAGTLMEFGNITQQIVDVVKQLVGRVYGGLGITTILACTFFAAISGSGPGTVAAVGTILVPAMVRNGYSKDYASAAASSGGTIGILIPPSIMLVSMGSYANVSVGKIFFAAIVPGLVLSLFYMIYVFVICHIHPDYGPAMTTEELAAMPLRERITGSLVNLIPPVILIVGVLGSIFTGWATPTEAAGVGALFSLILAIFYKQFSWKMLYDSLIDTAKTSAMVFIILFGASAFTGIFMSLDGDQLIATWISSVGIGKWGAFAIMMAIVFFMGMFLDWLGIVMIVFPIFLPIMDMFGFDRLWIVAVTAVMLQTCFMTPPFGFALFYIKGIVPPSVKIQEIYRGVIPFILIIIAVVILVTVFPQVVYFLPNLVAS